MITKIYKISSAIAILLLSMAFTACSPDEFEGADPNGLPTVSGVDFQISVDQETNQMIASYTPQPGTYPVWILDGTSYSTLEEVGYKNAEAGTHTIELRLGNRNGISQTGGSAAEAAGYVNQVRNRAGLDNLATVTIDDIFNERHLEFCGEGKRYFDLVRAEGIPGATQKASTVLVPDSYGYRTNSWTPSKKYIPLAQSELDADPTLVQNNY